MRIAPPTDWLTPTLCYCYVRWREVESSSDINWLITLLLVSGNGERSVMRLSNVLELEFRREGLATVPLERLEGARYKLDLTIIWIKHRGWFLNKRLFKWLQDTLFRCCFNKLYWNVLKLFHWRCFELRLRFPVGHVGLIFQKLDIKWWLLICPLVLIQKL